jgi:serine/threonine-protein phosphatase PGAM5
MVLVDDLSPSQPDCVFLELQGGIMATRCGTVRRLWIVSLALVAGLSFVTTACSAAEDDAKTDGVRTVYLIRHGDYDHEDERDPDIGKALVPLGVAQARIVGARLRGMPVEFTSLHSSTMTRARQTALVISEEFPDLELQTSRLIRECTPPTWREDVMVDETEEDLRACTENLEEAFPVYFAPSPDADRHDIVVCHGNVIRYFVTKVLKVDSMAWLGMSIGNCSLTVVKVKPDGSMKLLSYGDVGHLPPNLTTRTAPGKPVDPSVPE